MSTVRQDVPTTALPWSQAHPHVDAAANALKIGPHCANPARDSAGMGRRGSAADANIAHAHIVEALSSWYRSGRRIFVVVAIVGAAACAVLALALPLARAVVLLLLLLLHLLLLFLLFLLLFPSSSSASSSSSPSPSSPPPPPPRSGGQKLLHPARVLSMISLGAVARMILEL